MRELTTGWKFFRFICVLQTIAVGLQLILSVSNLFYWQYALFAFISTAVYLLLFVFLFQGLSIINYNYPDTPLAPRQKKYFNWLFLFNFLAIAFLFGQVISQWRSVQPLLGIFKDHWFNYIFIGFDLLLAVFVFISHLIFLAGMYSLRRLIYRNSEESWQQQFGEPKK